MGWDAFATKNGKDLRVNWSKNTLKDPELDRLFKNAHNYVKRKVGVVDGLLRIGGLDCSIYGLAIQDAVGETVWTEEPWDNQKVKELLKHAEWDGLEGGVCARRFLETCAKAGLGIRFSF